jgi:hypothetical protein
MTVADRWGKWGSENLHEVLPTAGTGPRPGWLSSHALPIRARLFWAVLLSLDSEIAERMGKSDEIRFHGKPSESQYLHWKNLHGFLHQVSSRVSEIKRFSFIAGKVWFSGSLLIVSWAWTALWQGEHGHCTGEAQWEQNSLCCGHHWATLEGMDIDTARLGDVQGTDPSVDEGIGERGMPRPRSSPAHCRALTPAFENMCWPDPYWPEPECGQ